MPAVPRIPSPEYVTTPATAWRAAVPSNTPPAGPDAIDAVTVALLVVTVFPLASTTATTGCVESVAPDASDVDEFVRMTRPTAGPGLRVSELVTEETPLAVIAACTFVSVEDVAANVRVFAPEAPVNVRPENVA